MRPAVVLLSIPGLRGQDLSAMPRLSQLVAAGEQATLIPGFPAVTCPVQANMTTGCPPREHGVVANGFYWRERREVEMWTASNQCIARPQIWDLLHQHDASITSAVWFALHSKECGADYVCLPAPIHNPDGSESLWCYTRPEGLYQTLLDQLGHFPLQHFWGPLATIASSSWIISSAIQAAASFRPDFFYIYLPHLDYAAQKIGPDSEAATEALVELDGELGRLSEQLNDAYDGRRLVWLVASEYVIQAVDHVCYPNRMLREAGLLQVVEREDGEHLDFETSDAWALVDHQLAHMFVKDANPAVIDRVAGLFRGQPGIAEVLNRTEQARYALDHSRSGELVLVSTPNSWQAYYWWSDDARAPGFARTVDIHLKPGYDPVELHLVPQRREIPLDATLVRGSHGAPAHDPSQRGVLLSSDGGMIGARTVADVDVAEIVLRQFGVQASERRPK